ncbi:MAG: ribbon-helix-helix protein, CopG family [Sulfuricellaceae bacterium]|nr:ribbon-helix-helix protein, CopG family [Sulfuricellaceae bacterium]
METQTTTIKLDAATKERIKQLAATKQRTPHWLMLEALREYVEREERREQFKRDALLAWEAYRETGEHVTGDEIVAWLETWGAENESKAPACRK